nr:sigma 54-interacting transcriptional regulator [Neobacillus sp. Marseille-Q6967]
MEAVLLDKLPFPFFITTSEDCILYSNDVIQKHFPLNGRYIYEVFDKWKEIRGNQVIHAQVGNKDCIFIKIRQADRDEIYYIGTFSTDLTTLLEELKESKRVNRELDAIIENSYDGIYITDREGITIKTNSAIERLTGIPKEYYIGKKVDALMKRGILKNSVTHRVLEKKRSVSLVQQNFLGREVLLTGNPVFDEQGEIQSIVTNIRDLSELNDLQAALKKANKLNNSYREEIERLKGKSFRKDGVVIRSEQLQNIYDTAARIANVDATVLILGETGTGKDVLARYIFENSERSRSGQMIKINCGAIPPDLLESELFGYEAGAFTGASGKGKVGMFELANDGVLFLDEVGELPLQLQVKLLRVIQEREVQRIGGTKSKKVDVRIIAATNRNLKEMVSEGKFREDLFYRLNVIPISIPPLSDRKADILPLVDFFLEGFNSKYLVKKKFSSGLKEFFYNYGWPGNVRELANLIERLVLVTEETILTVEDLPIEYKDTDLQAIKVNEMMTLKQAAELAEEKILQLALKKYHTTYELAEALDTSQPTIVRKLKKYNLKLSE